MKTMKRTIAPLGMISLCIAASVFPTFAQQSTEPAFPTPNQASERLFQAVQENDEQAIASLLGGQSELTISNDPGQDKADRELFIQKYQEMHRWGREADGSMTLYI